MGPLACGGQKDNSNPHVIIKVVTGFVHVIHKEKEGGKEKGGREEGTA